MNWRRSIQVLKMLVMFLGPGRQRFGDVLLFEFGSLCLVESVAHVVVLLLLFLG